MLFVLGLRELNGVGVATELRESLLLEMLFLICGLTTIYGIGVLDDLRGVSFRKNLWRRFLLRSFSFLEIFI